MLMQCIGLLRQTRQLQNQIDDASWCRQPAGACSVAVPARQAGVARTVLHLWRAGRSAASLLAGSCSCRILKR